MPTRDVVVRHFSFMKYHLKKTLALVLIPLIIACTTEPEESSRIIPTPGLFEVLTATPIPEPTQLPTQPPAPTVPPTATPTRVPTATPLPTATPVPLTPREFPTNIDPNLVSERPPEEEIFAAWTEYLQDAEVRFVGDSFGTHFCADGNTYSTSSEYGDFFWTPHEWDVSRHPGLAANEWQTVRTGPWNWTFSRKDGKTVRPLDRGDREVIVGDSWKCTESLVWEQVENAPVSPWRIHDVHTLDDDGSIAFLHDGQIIKFNPGGNWWVPFEQPELSGLWRMRYVPIPRDSRRQTGLIGFKGDEMWWINPFDGAIEPGPSLGSTKSIFWLLSDVEGEIYVGRGTEAEFDEIYSPDDDTWVQVEPRLRDEGFLRFLGSGANFHGEQAFASNIQLDEGRLMVGDPQSGAPWDMWIYEVETDTLTKTAESNAARNHGKLLELADSKVLLYFGEHQDGFRRTVVNEYELYDPVTDSWSTWESAETIEDGWAMSHAWSVGDDGTILGSFFHLDQEFPGKFGVLNPATNVWTYFDPPPGDGGSLTVIPMTHNRVMVLRELSLTGTEAETWLIKLP